MSLLRLRQSMRATAKVLLVFCLLGAVPHTRQDDVACERSSGAVVAHDETRHQLRAPGPIQAPEHCAVCHWISLRSPRVTVVSWILPVERPSRFDGAPAPLVLSPVFSSVPARAPPSA
jgi:hypothetical protein